MSIDWWLNEARRRIVLFMPPILSILPDGRRFSVIVEERGHVPDLHYPATFVLPVAVDHAAGQPSLTPERSSTSSTISASPPALAARSLRRAPSAARRVSLVQQRHLDPATSRLWKSGMSDSRSPRVIDATGIRDCLRIRCPCVRLVPDVTAEPGEE